MNDAPTCRGFGSSTSDVLAAVRAVGDAFDAPLPPSVVARLAVQAEAASDSLMYENTAVLFAHRDGEVIEDFGYALPPLHVLGFGAGLGDGKGVDTLALRPARYTSWEIGKFAELRTLLREAIANEDAGLLGVVATASMNINQRHLPIFDLDRIHSIAREVGAAGVQTAHSGDIASLLFDASDPEAESRIEVAQTLLRNIEIHEQWKFMTGARNEICNAS
ncbi:hypothetical protein ACHGLA_36670 [Streptomyces sp. YH02]|uniref:GHMP family kinase ATP-binding protein n=1 Tax=Streptomyces sp. YH02 TaxID=3256999 RepID=UPI0037581F57